MMKILCAGDARLTSDLFAKHTPELGKAEIIKEELNYQELLKVEQLGPSGMPVPQCVKEGKDVSIALCHYCVFSDEGMSYMPNLKIIATTRTGVENIDVDAATRRGIVCVNSPGNNAESVSDQAVGLLLSEALNISRMHANMMQKKWVKTYPSSPMVPLFTGKTVGILGFGRIGRMTANKLKGFQMKTLVYDPYVPAEVIEAEGCIKVDKETLFKEARFIIIHSRLSEETYHLVGKKEIESMRSDAYLVNNARSRLVDTEALIEALRNHRIAGAALDVFDVEPLEESSPLYELDNVTLTPHSAGGASEIFEYAVKMAVDGVKSVLDNQPGFQILNPEILATEQFQDWIQKANIELGR